MPPELRAPCDVVVREILVALRAWTLGPNAGDCLVVGPAEHVDPLVFELHAFYGATPSGSAAVAVVERGALVGRLRAFNRPKEAEAVAAGPREVQPLGAAMVVYVCGEELDVGWSEAGKERGP